MKQDIYITYNWKTKLSFFIPYKKATKINDFSQTRFEEALKVNVFSQTRFEELRMWEPVTTGVESGSVFEEARFLKVAGFSWFRDCFFSAITRIAIKDALN